MIEDSRLLELREALRRRSKAIGKMVRHWACERVDSDEVESLLVRMDHLSFRLWSDGVIWVHADQGESHVSFHATMGLVPATELVAAAEGSLLASGRDELVALWRRFQPYDV